MIEWSLVLFLYVNAFFQNTNATLRLRAVFFQLDLALMKFQL